MIAWFRLNLALLTARLVAAACRLFHYPGTSLPGVVALKVCPDAVNLMTPAYERVLAVTGTNGKTTTANLLADFLPRSRLHGSPQRYGGQHAAGGSHRPVPGPAVPRPAAQPDRLAGGG